MLYPSLDARNRQRALGEDVGGRATEHTRQLGRPRTLQNAKEVPMKYSHRIPVKEEKEAKLKGFYLHPELYWAPDDKQIEM